MKPNILVATDGMPGALGALRLARLLARRDGRHVDVIAVQEPLEVYGFGTIGAAAGFPPAYMMDLVAALQQRVDEQLATLGVDASAGWAVTVVSGPVAQTIAQAAERTRAGLILLGLQAGPAGERFLARQTVVRVLQLVHAPVLAVPADAATLPQRVVVALDASAFSVRAAEKLLQVVAPDAEVHLVHALWAPAVAEGRTVPDEWMKTYRSAVERQLDEVADRLRDRQVLDVQAHALSGDPARTILQYADAIGADLIAAGSHGHGFLGRLFLGSVSTKLLRGARCSMLIAPPGRAVEERSPAHLEPEVAGLHERLDELLAAVPPPA